MLLKNSSDIGVANAEAVLSPDGLSDLRGGPDAGLLLLGDGVYSELKLALLMALLLSELIDVVRVFFDFADQLTDESSSESEPCCCLFVAKVLYSHSKPQRINDVGCQLSSGFWLAPTGFLVKL